MNHPQVILRNWRKSGGATRPRGAANAGGEKIRKGYRPICFDQEAIRRAAMAMKESMSGDWFKLAAVAAHALVPNRDALLDLLNDPAPAMPRAPATAQGRPALAEAVAALA